MDETCRIGRQRQRTIDGCDDPRARSCGDSFAAADVARDQICYRMKGLAFKSVLDGLVDRVRLDDDLMAKTD